MTSLGGRIRRLEGLLQASIEEDPEDLATWARLAASMRCRRQYGRDCPHVMVVGVMRTKEDCPIEEEDRDWARSLLSSLRENGLEPTVHGVVLLAHRAKNGGGAWPLRRQHLSFGETLANPLLSRPKAMPDSLGAHLHPKRCATKCTMPAVVSSSVGSPQRRVPDPRSIFSGVQPQQPGANLRTTTQY